MRRRLTKRKARASPESMSKHLLCRAYALPNKSRGVVYEELNAVLHFLSSYPVAGPHANTSFSVLTMADFSHSE
jgi:hypothetical protein